MGLRFDGGLLKIRPTANPHGLRVEGEVDTATLPVFTRRCMRPRGGCPATSTWMSANWPSSTSPGSGRSSIWPPGSRRRESLSLSPESSHVHQLIKMIGWDTTPGLRLSGDDPT